jgi:hypothetical protein
MITAMARMNPAAPETTRIQPTRRGVRVSRKSPRTTTRTPMSSRVSSRRTAQTTSVRSRPLSRAFTAPASSGTAKAISWKSKAIRDWTGQPKP